MTNVQAHMNGTHLDGNYNDQTPQICVKKGISYVSSHGVFHGDSPLNFVLPITMLQIFLSLMASRIIYFLLRPLRTPRLVCNLLGGILLGPSILGRNEKLKRLLFPTIQWEISRLTAEIGVAYFIFMLAMKMEALSNLKNALRTWRFGLIPMFSSFCVMSSLFFLFFPSSLLHFENETDTMGPVRLVLCVTTSITTFPVMSENLLELNLITSELGQIALSASVLNDIIHWILIAVATIIGHEKNAKQSVGFLASYILFMAFCFFVIRPVMRRIAGSTPPGKPLKDAYVVMIQLGVLVAGTVSAMLGLSFIQGPLLLGLVMPHGPPLATTVIERTEPLISNYFLPMFFCVIGRSLDVFAIQRWGTVMEVQVIIIAGYLTKLMTCVLISLSYDIRAKHGLVLGLMFNLKGILDVIIFTKMRTFQMVTDEVFAHLVISVIAVTTIAFPLVDVLYKPHTRVEYTSTQGKTIRTIQNTHPNAQFRMVMCVHNEGEVRSMIALLEALNSFHTNPICVYVIHLLELLGKSTPILRRVNIHKKKSWSPNYKTTSYIMRAFDNYAKNSGDDSFVVVPCINIAPYKSMHISICNLVEDVSAPLIIVPFHQNDQSHGCIVTAAATRDINRKFQAYAPSTVGILVDRTSRLGISSTSFLSFNIAVFFMGGPDDREALALGMRMSTRENTSIVLFRFVVQKKSTGTDTDSPKSDIDIFPDEAEEKQDLEEEEEHEEEEEDEERVMDENLIDEFMAMKMGNGQVVFHEIAIEGSEQVFETIRCLEDNYDLVLVGKKHSVEIEGFDDEETVANFMENADTLGMFGDMLASREFCNGMVPVLVIQSGASRGKALSRELSVPNSSKSFNSRFW